jgi:hypothetical protein
MDDKIVEKLDSKAQSERARKVKLRTRRRRGADGAVEIVYVLDARSPNFDDQFLKLFQLNVAKARRETAELRRKRGIAAE